MRRYTFLLFILVSLGACKKDFVELPPESSLTEANFFKTEGDYLQALNGVYQSTRGAFAGNSSWLMGEMRSDNTHFEYHLDRGEPIAKREEIATFLDDSRNVWSNEKYFNLYVTVARANTIISRIQAAGLKQEFKDDVLGQAKLLRALAYFELVQYYGDVPLYTTEVKAPTEAYLARNAKEQVYSLILADVQEAVDKLPAPSFPQNGRANKGSAMTLLGHVHLVLKDYSKAETPLKEVTQWGIRCCPITHPFSGRPTKTAANPFLRSSLWKATRVRPVIFSTTLCPTRWMQPPLRE
jgi:hypothetical protein